MLAIRIEVIQFLKCLRFHGILRIFISSVASYFYNVPTTMYTGECGKRDYTSVRSYELPWYV